MPESLAGVSFGILLKCFVFSAPLLVDLFLGLLVCWLLLLDLDVRFFGGIANPILESPSLVLLVLPLFAITEDDGGPWVNLLMGLSNLCFYGEYLDIKVLSPL